MTPVANAPEGFWRCGIESKCSLSKYGFRASEVRTRVSAERAETDHFSGVLGSAQNWSRQQAGRKMASGDWFFAVSESAQSTVCPENPGNLPLSVAVGLAESTARMGTGGAGRTRIKATPAIFRPQFHSPRHRFHQPMLRRSIRKPFQIKALNLVGKIGLPSSFGEKPPIRREKARPFRPRTIKVSGEKPAITREFQSPPRAESKFA